MKRILFTTALAALLLRPAPAPAQSPAELDERLRRVERDLESVKEANDALRKKLATVDAAVAEVSRLAAERANTSNNLLKLTASKGELEQLQKALRESEQHREADKKWFIDQLKELGKVMSTPPNPTPPPPAVTPKAKAKSDAADKARPLPPGVPDTGVYHVVEKNQTALEILKAYNDDQKAKGKPGKLTLKQLEAANPGADMNKLRAGQKLFIPIP